MRIAPTNIFALTVLMILLFLTSSIKQSSVLTTQCLGEQEVAGHNLEGDSKVNGLIGTSYVVVNH